jgi:DNA-binding transcriptional LysR family regulator
MAKILDWDDHIGRRLRLRDLRVFFLVVKLGSFAKAAAQLRVSQPAVSRVIADLESTLGVKLFDRTTRGVEPTLYGRALLSRGRAAFDELRHGIGEIEFLADPGAGEIRIGSHDVLMAGFIAAAVDRLTREAPRVTFQTLQGNAEALRTALRERRVDVIVARALALPPADDLNSHRLFDERFDVVAGLRSPWVRRRQIELADLIDEPWVVPRPNTVIGTLLGDAFRSRGLPLPRSSVASDSVPLRVLLLATGRYLSVMPRSSLHFAGDHLPLKVIQVEMPPLIQPTEITTLKNRTLSPVVARFVEYCRTVAQSLDTSVTSAPFRRRR